MGPRIPLGALLAAASAVSYGSLAVLAKLAYGTGWNVPSLLVARFGLAALVIAPFALRGRGWKGFGGGLLVGALGYAGTTALYFPSLQRLPAAVASFLLYLAPVLVAVFAWLLFRERPTRRVWASLGLAVGGLALMASGALRGELSAPGVALAAGSAVLYAGTVLASRHLMGVLPWARASLAVCLGAAASYLLFSLSTGSLAVPVRADALAYALGIGVLATGVALSLFMAALPRIGASRTALVSTLEPVSTLVIAAVALDEIPGWTQVVGGLLIVAAAALVASAQTQTPAPHE